MSNWTRARHGQAKARCKAASKGPWLDLGEWLCVRHMNRGDRVFIEHARTDLPDALAEIERLQGVVMKAALAAESVPALERQVCELRAELDSLRNE